VTGVGVKVKRSCFDPATFYLFLFHAKFFLSICLCRPEILLGDLRSVGGLGTAQRFSVLVFCFLLVR